MRYDLYELAAFGVALTNMRNQLALEKDLSESSAATAYERALVLASNQVIADYPEMTLRDFLQGFLAAESYGRDMLDAAIEARANRLH